MKVRKFGIWTVALFFIAAGVISCQSAKESAENITSAKDFAAAETEFAGVFDITDDINQSDGKIKKGSSGVLPSGAVFTWVDSSFTDGDGIEYTLDFGPLGSTAPKGLLCGDGKFRAGLLRISVSKRYLEIGTVVTVLASASQNGDKYYSGDGTHMYGIEGELIITRTGAESLSAETKNGRLYYPDGSSNASFEGIRYIRRISGGGTPGIWGDVYEVTGNGKGKNIQGEDYTWNITEPLIKKMEPGCAKTFVIGVIEIKNLNNSSSLILDFDPYDNGACDRVAVAKLGKKEFYFVVQ